jgi:hypothetical protein
MAKRGKEPGLVVGNSNFIWTKEDQDKLDKSQQDSRVPAQQDSRVLPHIKKIVSFGTGYIIVLYDNGKKEKRSSGTISWRYNNPGNLKYGDFAKKYGSIGPGWGSHAVFPSLEEGTEAKKALLFSNERGYNKMTIAQAINKYAPANDTGKGVPAGGNKPNQYATWLGKKMNVPTSTVLETLSDDKKDEMLKYMREYEGFKVGVVSDV